MEKFEASLIFIYTILASNRTIRQARFRFSNSIQILPVFLWTTHGGVECRPMDSDFQTTDHLF